MSHLRSLLRIEFQVDIKKDQQTAFTKALKKLGWKTIRDPFYGFLKKWPFQIAYWVVHFTKEEVTEIRSKLGIKFKGTVKVGDDDPEEFS